MCWRRLKAPRRLWERYHRRRILRKSQGALSQGKTLMQILIRWHVLASRKICLCITVVFSVAIYYNDYNPNEQHATEGYGLRHLIVSEPQEMREFPVHYEYNHGNFNSLWLILTVLRISLCRLSFWTQGGYFKPSQSHRRRRGKSISILTNPECQYFIRNSCISWASERIRRPESTPLQHTDYRGHNCYRHIPTNVNAAIHQQHWGLEPKFVWLFCPVIGRFDIFWGFALCDILSSLKGISKASQGLSDALRVLPY